MSQAAALQTLSETYPTELAGVWLGIIDLPGYEEGIPDMVASGVTLPVLQDTYDAEVNVAWGAEKWYMYVIDPSGELKYLHYELDLPDDADRLFEEIAAARGAR